jgi:hypothetical protein
MLKMSLAKVAYQEPQGFAKTFARLLQKLGN